MSKFDSYFLMKPDDAIDYVKEKVTQFAWDTSSMQSKEIGDGNLNYVFRVWDDRGHSVIIKQAGHTARISKEMVLSTDRNRIESEILILEGKLAPGFVPKIYFFDVNMSACAEEDLTGHEIMRTCMLRHEIFPKFAEDISTFMANTLMGTTDIVMNHKEKKGLQRKFINPELCEITEDLVYTEPYNDCKKRNNVFAPNAEFVKKELYDDKELHCEVAKLKMNFMCNAQSLIHGDLHTGSVFITPDSTMVIDPEFAFYGPMGYDIGNVIANMIFAWCNGDAEIQDASEREKFCGWVEQVIVEVVDKTMAKMEKYYWEHVTDVMAKSEGYYGILHRNDPCRYRRRDRSGAKPQDRRHGQRQRPDHDFGRKKADPRGTHLHPQRKTFHQGTQEYEVRRGFPQGIERLDGTRCALRLGMRRPEVMEKECMQ